MGTSRILFNGAPLLIPSHKAQALLYYLAVEGRPVSRPFLAGLLWGDMTEERARANLRVTLTRLRQLLPHHVYATRQAIAFEPQGTVIIDVRQFEQCLRQGTAAHLETAVSLYQGHFLEDFHVRGAAAFEEWLLLKREQLRLHLLDALAVLIEYHKVRRHYAYALALTRRLLALEPWREEGHRQAMTLLALIGQRTAALAQYETCRRYLMNDLGIEPEAATKLLYDQIRDGGIGKSTGQWLW